MSETREPPGLPNVVDEAGDTPSWVPKLGLALLGLALLYAIVASEIAKYSDAPPKRPEAEVGAEVGAAPAK